MSEYTTYVFKSGDEPEVCLGASVAFSDGHVLRARNDAMEWLNFIDTGVLVLGDVPLVGVAECINLAIASLDGG